MLKRLGFIALCGLLFAGCSSTDQELHLYMWGNYIKPDLIERFEREHNCKVTIDTYDSNEAMYAKLKAGATGYDIIFPSNYIFDILYTQGMLQDIDEDLLPNLHHLDPFYLALIEQDQRNAGIPYMLTYTGVAYRKDKVHDIPHSWSVFGDSAYKGRMTMLNDMREVLGAALKYLGYSINTIEPQQLKEATALLIKWKPNLAKFESEQYQNGIASGEYLIAQGYSGDILQVMQDNASVEFFLPNEGSIISLDIMAIPRNSPHPELATTFMNFLLDPDVAAANIAYTFYLCPNSAAYEKLSPQLRQNPALFPPKEIFSKSEVIQNVGLQTRQYIEAWDRVKSAEL